jgi:hypothetical protein
MKGKERMGQIAERYSEGGGMKGIRGMKRTELLEWVRGEGGKLVMTHD